MYSRICKFCGNEIFYARKSTAKKYADARCKKCLDFSKENNPFYGKKHSQETKAKIASYSKDYTKTEDFSKAVKAGMNGKTNKRSVYDCWVDKYGKEIADQKFKLLNQTRSANAVGNKNSMYGKPSPTGSGNGWSGWYKGFYFRSLRELSFIYNLTNRFGFEVVSAEHIKIRYIDFKGAERTYRPDFLVNNKFLVEVKPVKLWGSVIVKFKVEAGKRLAKEKGFVYKLFDCPIMKFEIIKQFVDNGELVWLDRYLEKYNKWMKN